jgi:5-methylcytosine-specific restriction endonuclease McrA
MAVLLLNASFEPLTVIPHRRAMSLLMRERVDAATEDTTPVYGTHDVFHIPKVLRLRKYVNVPRRGARWSRRGVLERDQFTCIYCGVEAGSVRGNKLLAKRDFTLDHILPKSRSGKNTWGNTACACGNCNNRKGDRLPNEAGMKLLWEPKTPRVDYLVAMGSIPDAWKIYLEMS